MSDTYVAIEPLFIGRARAHNIGDEVPAENVERNGWADQVAKQGTKAAAKAVDVATGDSAPAEAPAS